MFLSLIVNVDIFRLPGKGPTLREGDTYSLVDPGSSRKRPIEAIEGQMNCFGVPYSPGVDLPGKILVTPEVRSRI